jgi:hypothetical protein
VRGEAPADAKVERATVDGQEVVMGVRRRI